MAMARAARGRPSRLEARVTRAGATSFVAGWVSLAMAFVIGNHHPPAPEGALTFFNVALGMTAAFGMATGRRWTIWANAVFAFLWLAIIGPGLENDSDSLTTAIVLIGAVFGTLLLSLLIAPVRAALLTTVLGIGLSFLVMWARERVAQIPIHAPPPIESSHFLFPRDPVLGWKGSPNFCVQQFYPSDPRRYFDPSDYFGPMDMRLWHWQPPPNHEFEVTLPRTPRGEVRVEIKSPCPTSQPVEIARQAIPFRGGQAYVVDFRARAKGDRTIDVRLMPNGPPEHPLWSASSVELEEHWQSFRLRVVPSVDVPEAWLVFDLGAAAGTVEMADISVWPAELLGSIWGRVDAGVWRLARHAGCGGKLTFHGSTARIETTKVDGTSWHIQCKLEGWPIRADEPIRLRGRFRTDAPREIEVQTLTVDYQGAARTEMIPVGTVWDPREVIITPTRTDASARICFNVGTRVGWIDIADLEIVPVHEEPKVQAPTGTWRLADPTGKARLESPSMTAPAIRLVGLDPSLGGRVILSRELVPVEPGERMGASFLLRGGAPGKALFQADLEAGAEPLGPPRMLTLSTEWERKYVEFPAPAEGPARLSWEPEPGIKEFEIRDLRLAPLHGAKGPLPSRFVVSYHFNSDGFRDREWTKQKPPGTRRIAMLGDSFTCGMGVHEPDTLPRQLEAALQSTSPTSVKRIEVMNFGIAGWDTRTERLCYDTIAREFHPDLVVLVMVHNDDMSSQEEEEAGLHEPSAKEGPAVAKLVRTLGRGSRPGFGRCVPEILALQAAVERDHARLLVVIYAHSEFGENAALDQEIRTGLAGTGIPIVSLLGKFAELATVGVHPLDQHPNELAHRIAAAEIAKYIKENHLLEPTASVHSGGSK